MRQRLNLNTLRNARCDTSRDRLVTLITGKDVHGIIVVVTCHILEHLHAPVLADASMPSRSSNIVERLEDEIDATLEVAPSTAAGSMTVDRGSSRFGGTDAVDLVGGAGDAANFG